MRKVDMSEEEKMSELAAMFDQHQVTGDDGQVQDLGEVETPVDDTANQDQQLPEDIEERVTEESDNTQEEKDSTTSEDLFEDESGKKYIPQDRFNKVYGKMKEYERMVQTIQQNPVPTPNQQPVKMDRADQLETELLYSSMPEFNPTSERYSRELDVLGATIYRANSGGITKIEAARQAKEFLKGLSQKQEVIRNEAKVIKKQQSDSGISSRTTIREDVTPDPDKMSLEEKESYLKANGLW